MADINITLRVTNDITDMEDFKTFIVKRISTMYPNAKITVSPEIDPDQSTVSVDCYDDEDFSSLTPDNIVIARACGILDTINLSNLIDIYLAV